MTVSDATLQWLRDAPAASAEALAALTTVDPPPVEETESDMDYPKNEAELRACLSRYAAENYVGQLDPRTKVEVGSTIEIAQPSHDGVPWGVNGNYAKLHWKGPHDQDMLRFVGVQDVNNRCLTIEKLVLNGGDIYQNGAGAASCLKLSAPLGDSGPLYKFTVRDVFTMHAKNGVVLEGGVYEGVMENVHAENCTGDGIFMQHLNLGAPGQGVVSNVLLIHPNCSRCYGAGIHAVYSTYIIGGSFILNGNGGVRAPDGLRGMLMSNGENTAGKEGAAFVLPNNGYGSVVNLCEGSSDGATHCRAWNGAAWVSIGSPMKYLMSIASGVQQEDNHVSYYGAPPDPMQVVGPVMRGAPPAEPGALHKTSLENEKPEAKRLPTQRGE